VGETSEELLKRADEALYANKRASKRPNEPAPSTVTQTAL
jgi:predicted signal transduction protein with EAL and GGDEF domain